MFGDRGTRTPARGTLHAAIQAAARGAHLMTPETRRPLGPYNGGGPMGGQGRDLPRGEGRRWGPALIAPKAHAWPPPVRRFSTARISAKRPRGKPPERRVRPPGPPESRILVAWTFVEEGCSLSEPHLVIEADPVAPCARRPAANATNLLPGFTQNAKGAT